MANMFEKPIAATPMSTFVEMPLQYLEKSLEARQKRHDTALADLDAMHDSLLGVKYLPGDREAAMGEMEKYQKDLDSIADYASERGDYSTVQADLDYVKRRMKKDMNYGALKGYSTAYDRGMEFKKVEDKKYAEGKSSIEGYNLANRALTEHKTTLREDGSYSPFQERYSSVIKDPTMEIQKYVKEIEPATDANGYKYVDEKRIRESVNKYVLTNSGLQRSILEKVGGDETKYEAYKNFMVENIVKNKVRQDRAKLSERGGGGTGITQSIYGLASS